MRSLDEIKYMNEHPEEFVGPQGEVMDKLTQQILKSRKIGFYLPEKQGIIDVFFVQEEMETPLDFPVFKCLRKTMQNISFGE